MKLTGLLSAAAVAGVVAAKHKTNTMETTQTVVINEDSHKSTHRYGRFDHTTRVSTTTWYAGKDGSRSPGNDAANAYGFGGAIVALAAWLL